jgi:hypothetical protein
MKRKHRAGPTAKDIASNPGYVALVERLVALIDKWCATEPGLPDLRWHEPGDTMFIGALQGKALDYLAASPDARRLLEWLNAQTNHEATLFQATVALRMLGHLPDKASLQSASEVARSKPMTTTQHEETQCPDCGGILSAASAGEGKRPKPGDIGVCIQCGCYLEYDERTLPRALSPEGFAQLPEYARESLRAARQVQQQAMAIKARET